MSKLFTALASAVATRPRTTLLVVFILTAVSTVLAAKLEARLNYVELLPDDAPEVVDMRRVMAKSGADGFFILEIAGGSREQRLGFGDAATAALQSLPVFSYVEYRRDVAFFERHAPWLLPIEQMQDIAARADAAVHKAVEASLDLGLDDDASASQPVDTAKIEGLLAEYERAFPKAVVENKDATKTYVFAKPMISNGDVGRLGQLLADVDKVIAPVLADPKFAGVTAVKGGSAVFQKRFDEGLRRDLGTISLVSLVASFLLLWMSTRRMLAALLIVLSTVVAICITLATTYLLFGHITIITGLLISVILGLGVEFGLHLFARGSEERANAPDVETAVFRATPDTMNGAALGAITNAAAFFSLLFCQFSAFREFGAITGIGVLVAWISAYTFLPSLIILVERRFPGALLSSTTSGASAFSLIRLPKRGLGAMVSIVTVLAGLGVYGATQIGVERNFAKLQGEHHPDPAGRDAQTALGSSITPVVIEVKDIETARSVERIYAEIIEKQSKDRAVISGSLSFARFFPNDIDARKTLIASLDRSLRRMKGRLSEAAQTKLDRIAEALKSEPPRMEHIPDTFRRAFSPLKGDGTFVIVSNGVNLEDGKNLDDFVAAIDEGLAKAKAQGIETHTLSENRIAVRIFERVFADAPFIGSAAMIVVFLSLLIALRSLKQALIVFSPILCGVALAALAMWVSGIKLNFINMTVIPSVFTVAVDNAIHLYHRIHRGEPLSVVLPSTGNAVVFATLVNAAGYGSTMIADFYGIRSLGYISMMGVMAMLFTTAYWFPALLKLLGIAKEQPVREATTLNERVH
jgi:predicted RND superfamily exporter protein